MEAIDVGVTPTQFEKDMQELVAKGFMRQTGPGTYAITEAGEQRVAEMRVDVRQAVTLEQLAAKIEQANEQRRGLIKAAKATLMFHQGGPWSQANREAWLELTGREEASTRSLCDFVREQLEKAVDL